MLWRSFTKAVGQLGDPATRGVMWIGVAVAAAVFALLLGAVGLLVISTVLIDVWWLAWAEWIVDLLGGLATLWITWLMFPGVVTLMVGFLLERVAAAVERRHYPDLPPAPGQTVMASVVAAARFTAVMVLLNLGLLVFLLLPPVFPFVFYGVNGYLLGREYFELVALRRLDSGAALGLRQRNAGPVFLAGVATALLLTVPIVNLLTPVVATAAMVHLFEEARARAGRP